MPLFLIPASFVLAYCGVQFAMARRLAGIPADDRAGEVETVAILVAARNEENNLPRCLEALTRLDYPADKLRVLIADDGSTDATPQILADFVRDRPHWRVLTITERLGSAQGKANALAHLIREADTDLLLCCDADVAVAPAWARTMVAEARRAGAALVVGTTLIAGDAWLAVGQHFEWLRALAALRVATERGQPFTGMGNNQLLARPAYLATGGYEALPFSVTEDFQLFGELHRRGGRTTHVFGAGALAWSRPAPSWRALLAQRRRWLRGLLAAPATRPVVAVVAEGMVFPALLLVAVLGAPRLALGLWALKWASQSMLLRLAARRLQLAPPSLRQLLAFEPYLLMQSIALPVVALWPGRVRWKGREL